ncbi:MAG: signal peptidase I [bacterium]|nr:signal peptidase I [bacterium]
MAQAINFVAVLAVLVFVTAFQESCLQANKIPAASMIPTLKVGDYIFVGKASLSLRAPFSGTELWRLRDPQRGEVVTFHPPDEDRVMYVKRVVGLPGDRIRLRSVPLCDLAADLAANSQPAPAAQLRLTRDGHTAGEAVELPGLCGSAARIAPYDAPTVAVLEYRDQDQGPWLNFGPRPLSLAAARELLSDAGSVGALQPEQRPNVGGYDLPTPILVQETAGQRDYVTVEKSRDSSDFALCPTMQTSGCVLPETGYYLLGDNRDDSKDSRYLGVIDRSRMIGVPLRIYMSLAAYDEICEEFARMSENMEGSADGEEGGGAAAAFDLPGFPPADQQAYCVDDQGSSSRFRRMHVRWERLWQGF